MALSEAEKGPSEEALRVAARLEEIQERIRATVDTPEMRRLAEGLERARARTRAALEPLARQAEENRKGFEPLAREAEKVRREMEHAFEASGLAGRLAEIQSELFAGSEVRRVSETLQRLRSEASGPATETLARLTMESAVPPRAARIALEALRRESAVSSAAALETMRGLEHEGLQAPPPARAPSPALPVASCPPPDKPGSPLRTEGWALPDAERLRTRTPLRAARRRKEEREVMAAAIEEGLRRVFPPDFIRFVVELVSRSSGAGSRWPRRSITTEGGTARTPPSPVQGPEEAMRPKERALAMLVSDIGMGRPARSMAAYARAAGCNKTTLSRYESFKTVFLRARSGARRSGSIRTVAMDRRSGRREVVDDESDPARLAEDNE